MACKEVAISLVARFLEPPQRVDALELEALTFGAWPANCDWAIPENVDAGPMMPSLPLKSEKDIIYLYWTSRCDMRWRAISMAGSGTGRRVRRPKFSLKESSQPQDTLARLYFPCYLQAGGMMLAPLGQPDKGTGQRRRGSPKRRKNSL